MNLYIKIENDQAVEHPAFEDNLLDVFNGQIPDHWKPFIRKAPPVIGAYEILDPPTPIYQKIDGVWQDVWTKRDMTNEERLEAQARVVHAFNNRPQAENWAAWTLDEETCSMQPPIPKPPPDQEKINQRIYTFWCGAENNWKETPQKPENGNYEFNFLNWTWVRIVND